MHALAIINELVFRGGSCFSLCFISSTRVGELNNVFKKRQYVDLKKKYSGIRKKIEKASIIFNSVLCFTY